MNRQDPSGDTPIAKDDVRQVEATWSVTLPDRFPSLYDGTEWNALRLANGELFGVCHPALAPSEIVSVFALRADWELPERFVPLIGDFHDLIGLDFSRNPPAVVALSDSRSSLTIANDFDAFLASRVTAGHGPSKARNVIESESWLDF